MKQFLKFTLATIVGIIITSFIGLLLFFITLGVIAGSASEKSVKLESNSIYKLELNGELTERSKDDPFSGIFAKQFGSQVKENIGLDDILSNIKKAKDNDKIKGIYLVSGDLYGGYASIEAIRQALKDFKESGKFIVSYADTYSQKMYYLCSVADKMYMNPQGMLEFQGIAYHTMFYKNLLNKIGVDMQVVRVGTFKSAVEPYILDKMSDANKEQVTKFIGSIWGTVTNGIAESRKISVDSLNALADKTMAFQPVEMALNAKMVDSLVYEDAMDSIINKRYLKKGDKDKDINYVSNDDMKNVSSDEKMEKQKVAIIYAVGGIDMPGEDDGIASKDLVKTINKVKKDKSIKSVVFRVNSPGGSAFGSEQILNAVKELKKEKPVIVSMGDYAASGGYYISCAADSIIAEPTTLTGSIGIFGMIPNLQGLYNKIGVNFDGVNTNANSDAITTDRPFTPYERNLMQNYVNRGYELFVKRVSDGRGKTADEIKGIAEGRVWTGADALNIGLVDKLGSLDDAIKIAAKKAKLDKYNIESYPEKEDFFTTFLKDFKTSAQSRFVKENLGDNNYMVLKQIQQAEKMNGIYMMMPFAVYMN